MDLQRHMILLKDLLIGAKVRVTEDCVITKKGEIYEIENSANGNLQLKGTSCTCWNTWELVELPKGIKITLPPHKHTFKCEGCGEEK